MRSRLVLLVDAGGAEIFQHHRARNPAPARSSVRAGSAALGGGELVDQLLVARGTHAVRRQALDRERPGDADAAIVLIGPVVEQFDIGAPWRSRRRSPSGARCAPPTSRRAHRRRPGIECRAATGRAVLGVRRSALACSHARSAPSRSRGISHSSQARRRAPLFSSARSGSSTRCHFSQITSISALLAIDFSVMCGTRS